MFYHIFILSIIFLKQYEFHFPSVKTIGSLKASFNSCNTLLVAGCGLQDVFIGLSVDPNGIFASFYLGTFGSLSIVKLSSIISGCASFFSYSAKGANLPFFILSRLRGEIPTSSNPLIACSYLATHSQTLMKT